MKELEAALLETTIDQSYMGERVPTVYLELESKIFRFVSTVHRTTASCVQVVCWSRRAIVHNFFKVASIATFRLRKEKPVLDWTKMMDVGAESGLIEDQDVSLNANLLCFD